MRFLTILLVLVAAGCLGDSGGPAALAANSTNSSATSSSTSTSLPLHPWALAECGNSSRHPVGDTCYLDYARSLNDSGLCDRVQITVFRDRCLEELGLKLSDKTVCWRIRAEDRRNVCLWLLGSSLPFFDPHATTRYGFPGCGFKAKYNVTIRSKDDYVRLLLNGSLGNHSLPGFEDSGQANRTLIAAAVRVEQLNRRTFYSLSDRACWEGPGPISDDGFEENTCCDPAA